MLDYYSTQLSSVEINYTFRRFPSEQTVQKWRAKAAEGLRLHAEGEPADHALEEAEGRRRRRAGLRDARQIARRSLRVRAVPMPAVARPTTPSCSKASSRRSQPTGRRMRWSSATTRGRQRATACSPPVSVGASPRPTRRTRRPRISPGSPSATSACARRSTRTRSYRVGQRGSSPRSTVAPRSSVTSSTRTRARHRRWRSVSRRCSTSRSRRPFRKRPSERPPPRPSRSSRRRRARRSTSPRRASTATSPTLTTRSTGCSKRMTKRTERIGGRRSSAASARWRSARRRTSGCSSTRSCWTNPRSGTSSTARSRAGSSRTGSCRRSRAPTYGSSRATSGRYMTRCRPSQAARTSGSPVAATWSVSSRTKGSSTRSSCTSHR